ncbi:MAG: sensor domain-containing diguanylate cyclase [Pseudomonadota bacterium]
MDAERNVGRWSVISRLSLGLLALAVFLALALVYLLDLPLDGEAARQRLHTERARLIATATLGLMPSLDRGPLQATLERLIQQDPVLAAIAVRRLDGQPLVQARAAGVGPVPSPDEPPSVVVPLNSANGSWGTVEVRFAGHAPSSVWLRHRAALVLGGAALLAFLGFYLYLRTALEHLDPTAVIPDRVRQAFDILTQGVLLLDMRGRVVLANAAFRALHDDPQAALTGKLATALGWLNGTPKAVPLWQRACRSETPVRDQREVALGDGSTRRLIVHGAAVKDAGGQVRGCILTFDDVTALDRANAELRQAFSQLEASRAQIELQNVALQRLATSDALTGCLNRRGLQDSAGPAFAQAVRQGETMACVMFDIDHFKSVNDRFGHSVGDEVIRSVAALVFKRVRESDYFCRYGGEEFCVLMPATTVAQARSVAEDMRKLIASQCSAAVPGLNGSPLTSSFGVASTEHGAAHIDGLIDLADQALYVSKQQGRNRVSVYAATGSVPAPAAATAPGA